MNDEDKERIATQLRVYKCGVYAQREDIPEVIEYVEKHCTGSVRAFALTIVGMTVNTTLELAAKMIEND